MIDVNVCGWTPGKIKLQYPHLSLADIHAAMAFYYDHQAEVDAQIANDRADYEALRASAGESAVVRKLRAKGKLA